MPRTALTPRLHLILILTVFSPLFLAIMSEWIWGLQPCHLCIIQRIPYAVMTLLALASPFFRKPSYLFLLLSAGFIASSVAALYHVGVEQGVIALSETCAGTKTYAQTAEAMLAEILKSKPRCDNPTIILGLSMASWNALYSLGMSCVMFVIFVRHHRNLSRTQA